MITVPIWVWIVSFVGPAGILATFVRAMPRERRPDVVASELLRVALVVLLAGYGVFIQSPNQAVPWLGPIILISLAMSLSSLRSTTLADLADLTQTQTFRVMGWVFLVMMLLGQLPAQFALPAGIGDISVGLLAPVIARRLRRGDTRGAVSFHALGILDMAVAITIGFFSAPGPYRLFGGAVSTAPVTVLPLVLIPTIVVPLAIAIHTVAIRRLAAARRTDQPATAPQPIHA
jgi:hypothetical protein